MGRILTSNWFAVLILLLAAGCLALLYTEGKTREALAGAALLAVAALFIIWGMITEKKK